MHRIIQVGLGAMGRAWAQTVAETGGWEPAAYVDVDRQRLLAAAAQHGMPESHCFTDLAQALNEIETDALLDVTPPDIRKNVCSAAFARKIPVLTEKPLADSMRTARSLALKAEKAGVPFMVAQNYRFSAEAFTVRQFIESGRLGELGYVSVQFHRGPHFGGFREVMPNPLLLDMAIHHVDLVRYFLDTDLKRVSALCTNPGWSWFGGNAAAMMQLETAAGVPVSYVGSWVAQGKETSYNGDWRLDGSKGCLSWTQAGIEFAPKSGKPRVVKARKYKLLGRTAMLAEFSRALRTGEEPQTSARQNLNSLAAVHAAVRSARTKRRVAPDDLVQ